MLKVLDLSYAGRLIQQRQHSFKPAMRRGGIPAEKVDQLSKDAQNEVRDPSRHVFWRYHSVYGLKL